MLHGVAIQSVAAATLGFKKDPEIQAIFLHFAKLGQGVQANVIMHKNALYKALSADLLLGQYNGAGKFFD